MTLAVTIATHDSIWTLADRQLMAGSRVSSTNAREILGIDSTDGIALVGYAGLGMVAGLDPADWAKSVFQGVKTDLQGYMTSLAEAVSDAVPPAERSAAPGHLWVAAGVVEGRPVLYSLVAERSGRLRLRVYERPDVFLLAGSGGSALRSREQKLVADGREILDWIKRVETDEAHPREVTDRLAAWNAEAGRESGSHAMVAYRLVRDGEVAPGRCFYNGTRLEAPDCTIPQITRGVDVDQIFELMKKQAMGGALTAEEAALLEAYKEAESDSGA